MEKLTLTQLEENTNWEKAVIVFKEESFDKSYSELERSYMISRDNKWFKPYALGNSLFGNCLDGKDLGVRLDWYMKDEYRPWLIDYCYIFNDSKKKGE